MSQKKNISRVQESKKKTQKSEKISLYELKRGVKRNNINSISSNNNSTINIGRSSNKPNHRAEWTICKGTKCGEYI